jgi:hypothetical protein
MLERSRLELFDEILGDEAALDEVAYIALKLRPAPHYLLVVAKSSFLDGLAKWLAHQKCAWLAGPRNSRLGGDKFPGRFCRFYRLVD